MRKNTHTIYHKSLNIRMIAATQLRSLTAPLQHSNADALPRYSLKESFNWTVLFMTRWSGVESGSLRK